MNTVEKYLYNEILNEISNTESIKFNKESKKILDLISKKTDFLAAPASTKHHLAFEGGLAVHTLGVIRALKNNLSTKNYKVDNYSAVKCALLHDLCKTNYYIKQKDETYIFDKNIKGHGDRSVQLCEKLGIKLNDSEKAMIEFHMGPFAPMGSLSHIEEIENLKEAKDRLIIVKDYQSRFSQAVQIYPEILAIYSADHLSSVKENSITKEQIIAESNKFKTK